jgi:hypothetical protein
MAQAMNSRIFPQKRFNNTPCNFELNVGGYVNNMGQHNDHTELEAQSGS